MFVQELHRILGPKLRGIPLGPRQPHLLHDGCLHHQRLEGVHLCLYLQFSVLKLYLNGRRHLQLKEQLCYILDNLVTIQTKHTCEGIEQQ